MNAKWFIRVVIVGTLVYLFRHECWWQLRHFLHHH